MNSRVDPALEHVWLVSFADPRLIEPRNRLRKQALAFGFRPDHVLIMDDGDLDPIFLRRMGKYMIPGTKGYGFYCWKPQICQQALGKISDGDILLYLDVGCHLNSRGKARFYEYLLIAREHSFCGFQSRSLVSTRDPDPRHHVYLNRQFTKGDVFDYFGVRERKDITDAGQMAAAVIFFKKCAESMDFVQSWKDVYCNNFTLMDDSPSHSPNLDGFIKNRHDQSTYSILWLMRRYPTISGCEIEPLRKYAPAPKEFIHDPKWGPAWFYQMKRYPILAKRDKGTVCFARRLWNFALYRLPAILRGGY